MNGVALDSSPVADPILRLIEAFFLSFIHSIVSGKCQDELDIHKEPVYGPEVLG